MSDVTAAGPERDDAAMAEEAASELAAERAEARAAAAWAAFETICDEVNALICSLRAGETAQAKRLAPAATELARAVNRMADDWHRLQDRVPSGGTGDGNRALDLAAARTEVSRRLAELRSAGG